MASLARTPSSKPPDSHSTQPAFTHDNQHVITALSALHLQIIALICSTFTARYAAICNASQALELFDPSTENCRRARFRPQIRGRFERQTQYNWCSPVRRQNGISGCDIRGDHCWHEEGYQEESIRYDASPLQPFPITVLTRLVFRLRLRRIDRPPYESREQVEKEGKIRARGSIGAPEWPRSLQKSTLISNGWCIQVPVLMGH